MIVRARSYSFLCCTDREGNIRHERAWGKKNKHSGWLGGKGAHWSEISGIFLHGPSIRQQNAPSLLPSGCDAPSLSISRNFIWTNTLSHPSRAGPCEGLIDGAKTNANHAAPYPSAKGHCRFRSQPWHTPRRQEDLFSNNACLVDIRTGHDIWGITVMSAAPGATDMNNRVDQTSSGCISVHRTHFLRSIVYPGPQLFFFFSLSFL